MKKTLHRNRQREKKVNHPQFTIKFSIFSAAESVKTESTPMDDEEIDPLDAFMVDVNQEVQALKNAKVMKKQDQRGNHMNKGVGKSKFMVVSRDDKSSSSAGPNGEIIEQHADSDVFEASGEMYGGLSGRLSLETKGKNLAVTDHSKVYCSSVNIQ